MCAHMPVPITHFYQGLMFLIETKGIISLCSDMKTHEIEKMNSVTALALSQKTCAFDFSLFLKNKSIVKVDKICDRIIDMIISSFYDSGVSANVDLQFDKTIASINHQLVKSNEGIKAIADRLKRFDQSISEDVNSGTFKHVDNVLVVQSQCESIVFLIERLIHRVANSRNQIDRSGLNRTCMADTCLILSELERNLGFVGFLFESVTENLITASALLEEPIAYSEDPELNLLLG